MHVGHPKTIDEFEYSDGDIGDIMTACASNTTFLGISGLVKFEKTGDPMKNIRLDQIQGL